MHEPLSLLQRSCELFKNAALLDRADESQDPLLRLAYVMAFAFSFYQSTIARARRPFAALLGETYEFTDPIQGFTFEAEQVTHSRFAAHCVGKRFTFWSETEVRMLFWGKNMEFLPEGLCQIRLASHADHYVFTRPTSSVEDILTSAPFVDNYGAMIFKNLANKQSGQLSLKKRGFNNKNACQAEGCLCDEAGNEKYQILGDWSKFLKIHPTNGEEEIVLWLEESESPSKNPYGFTDFSRELNNLNRENVLLLPLSDSRFRADIRALEYGLLDLAREEFQRSLERQERAKRSGEKHEPRLFEKVRLTETETAYLFKKDAKQRSFP